MVGRSSVAPLLLVMAALATAPPATAAEPQSLLPDLLLARPAEPASPSSAAPPPPISYDAADSEVVDPTEPIALPAVGGGPSSPPPQVWREPATDSGEVGVEYQLSVRAAESLLDRLSARFKRLVEQAMTYLGTPYRMGGTSRRGLDCSGLVGAVYGEQGLELPRTAAQQFGEGVAVAAGDLRPGDLVFFRDTYKRGISHVGIYIGEGRFLHAAGRRHGVIVSELSRPYYRMRYAGARRPAADTPALAATAGPSGQSSQSGQSGQSRQDAPDLAADSSATSTQAAAPRS